MERKIDAIAAYVQDRFDTWKAARSELETNWDGYYRDWLCIEDPQDATRQSERSRIKIPAIKQAVNNAVDALMSIVFAADPFFKLSPYPSDPNQTPLTPDRISRVERQAAYIHWLFQRETVETKIHDMLTEMCVYGTAIGRIRPCKKTRSVIGTRRMAMPFTDPATGESGMIDGPEEPIREETTQVYPEFGHVNIWNFYVPPTAHGVQREDGADGVIVRCAYKNYELLDMKANGTIDSVPDNLQDGSSTATLPEQQQDRLQDQGLAAAPHPLDIEVLDWWGFVPDHVLDAADYKGKRQEGGAELHVMVANGRFVLNDQQLENPYYANERPFVRAVFERNPGFFYGIGIPQISAGPQKALNATVRQRIDNKAIAINQLFAANIRKLTPNQNLKVYPGKMFLTEGPPQDVIQQFTVQDVTGSLNIDAREYERYVEAAHGIHQILGGGQQPGTNTATEASIQINQSSQRIKVIAKGFEDSVIEPLLRWYNRILIQYMQDGRTFTQPDPMSGTVQIVQIERDDLQDDVDFLPMGSVATSAQNSSQKLLSFAAFIGGNPAIAPMVNWPYLLAEVYKGIGRNDAHLMLNPNPLPAAQLMSGQQVPGATPASQPAELGRSAPEQPGTVMERPTAPGGTPSAA